MSSREAAERQTGASFKAEHIRVARHGGYGDALRARALDGQTVNAGYDKARPVKAQLPMIALSPGNAVALGGAEIIGAGFEVYSRVRCDSGKKFVHSRDMHLAVLADG